MSLLIGCSLRLPIGCLQTRDSDDTQLEGRKWIFLNRNLEQKLNMPVFCIAYECSNWSNGENTRTFIVKKKKVKKLTENTGKSIL